MSQHRAAYRYALSLFEVALETKCLDQVSADLVTIESVIASSTDFALFLKSPIVKTFRKKSIMSEIFDGKVNALTMKFLLLLVAKEREPILREIIKRFFRLKDERTGVLDVTARTAVGFSKPQEDELARRLGEATKKKIRIRWIADPALKGGFTVQYEDTVWDASVRRQLELLRESLLAPAS
jgi:F-type H+-transporting ATPase subunit delta